MPGSSWEEERPREDRGPRGGPHADGGRDCRAASRLRASVSPALLSPGLTASLPAGTGRGALSPSGRRGLSCWRTGSAVWRKYLKSRWNLQFMGRNSLVPCLQLLFSRSVVSDSCDPMDGRTPGLPVLHHLLEFSQTHVHGVDDAIQPSHPLSFPVSGSLPMSQSSHQGAESPGRVFGAHGPSPAPYVTAKWTSGEEGRQEVWDAVCWPHVCCAGARGRRGGVDSASDVTSSPASL